VWIVLDPKGEPIFFWDDEGEVWITWSTENEEDARDETMRYNLAGQGLRCVKATLNWKEGGEDAPTALAKEKEPEPHPCMDCGGSGVGGYVSREMALDGCDPQLEGQPITCGSCDGDGVVYA
jgi:hypothetical protein